MSTNKYAAQQWHEDGRATLCGFVRIFLNSIDVLSKFLELVSARHLCPALCSEEIEMANYLVRLNGKNFLLDDDKGPRKKRFRSTRLVEAENQNRAETLARELISNDPRLQNSVLNEESDPPILNIESVIEVPAMAYDAQNRAHSLYWEDEDTEE